MDTENVVGRGAESGCDEIDVVWCGSNVTVAYGGVSTTNLTDYESTSSERRMCAVRLRLRLRRSLTARHRKQSVVAHERTARATVLVNNSRSVISIFMLGESRL